MGATTGAAATMDVCFCDDDDDDDDELVVLNMERISFRG
jgi:hypothetical protein